MSIMSYLSVLKRVLDSDGLIDNIDDYDSMMSDVCHILQCYDPIVMRGDVVDRLQRNVPTMDVGGDLNKMSDITVSYLLQYIRPCHRHSIPSVLDLFDLEIRHLSCAHEQKCRAPSVMVDLRSQGLLL